jgi:hypothetical protein
MVEEEQDHRIKYEEHRLAASTSDHKRGTWMGFVLSLASVAGAVFTAHIGAHPTVSIALVSLPVMAAVRSFIRRKP